MATFTGVKWLLLRICSDKCLSRNSKLLPSFSLHKNRIHTSSVNCLFFEEDPKGGYERPKPSTKEIIRNSLKQIREEIEVWKTEVNEAWEGDIFLKGMPGK